MIEYSREALPEYNRAALEQELVLDEGRYFTPYKDSLGYWLVGVGHLLSEPEMAKIALANAITREECAAFLAEDIAMAEKVLNFIFPPWRQLDDVRQRAMLNLTFNLGYKLRTFQHFLAAMRRNDWDNAADALIDSTWYVQVKTRGPRIVRMIREGKPWWHGDAK